MADDDTVQHAPHTAQDQVVKVGRVMIDAHCHLQDTAFDADRVAVLASCSENTVTCVNAADSFEESKAEVELAGRFPFVFAVVGIHPHHVGEVFDEQAFRGLLTQQHVVGVGEIGLDYSGAVAQDAAMQKKQEELFRQQLVFAQKEKKPVVVHCRDAYADVFHTLQDFPNIAVMMHTFAADVKMAEQFLGLGAFLSFSGIITFPKAESVRQSVLVTPLEKLLIETDAPYLAPEPFRGKRNEPKYVRLVAEKIAEIKNIPVEQILRQTTENAVRFFHLPST